MRTAQTFVWVEDNRIIAYYALAGHKLIRGDLPKRIARGGPQEIPAVMLGKLALHHSLHHQGLGEQLLLDAFGRDSAATQTVAARLVVVDAIDEEAARFYRRYGFVDCDSPEDRLVMKISEIEAAASED